MKARENPLRVGIIGGGASGLMVAVQLLRLASRPLKITLIERQQVIGQGIAYRTNISGHLLNVPAQKMSVFPDDPDHFSRWLARHYPDSPTNSFVPRKYYRYYLHDVLKEAREKARPTISLVCLKDEAIDLENQDNQTIITCKSGERIFVDRVVLAVGNPNPSNPPVATPAFYESRRYIPWAWSIERWKDINLDQPILLVGSGLTAIDIAVALDQQGFQNTIHVVSRRGLLPHLHQKVSPYTRIWQTIDSPLTIRELFKQVRQEVDRATSLGYDWRAVIDSLRPYTATFWQKLPLTEKRRFLRHSRSYWEVHRHRVAPEVSAILDRLCAEKKLILHAGRIQAYQEDYQGVRAILRLKNSDRCLTLSVGSVVNCTGSERLSGNWGDPFVKNLLAKGYIRLDDLSLGFEVDADGTLIEATGKLSLVLHTLGPTRKGCLWETTAIPEIRQQAEILARNLLNSPIYPQQIEAIAYL